MEKKFIEIVKRGKGARVSILDPTKAEGKSYCTVWKVNKLAQRATVILPSILISIINIIICMIFERLAYLEGSHSTNDESKR